MEVLAECKDRIKDADMVLIGIGKEFGVSKDDILANNLVYKELNLEESSLDDLEKQWIEHTFIYDSINDGQNKAVMEKLNLYNGLFKYLNSLGKNNYFVVTTCNDDIVTLSDFDKDRIVAPLGTYGLMKCHKGCFKTVYETKEVFDNIKSIIDKYRKTDDLHSDEMWNELKDAMPQCPMCKQVMSVNLYKTNNYSAEGYREQWDMYTAWLQKTLNRKIVMLELSEGFDTPTVIRWPFEKVAAVNNKAVLIRVNEKFWQIAEDIEGKAISVKSSGIRFIEDLVK